MKFNFYWRFSGLCLFVPKYDIYTRHHDGPPYTSSEGHWYRHNRMRVLLVDALGAGYASAAGHSHHDEELHEPHLPVLVCPYESVVMVGPYRQPDATFYVTDALMRQTGERMAVFYLDDQDLYRAPFDHCSLSIIHYSHSGTGCAENYKDPELNCPYNSFAWVAPLAKISPGSELIRDECFVDGSYEYVDPLVIARVRLTRGELRSLRMAMDGRPEVLEWGFRVPGRRRRIWHNQSLADVVELRDYVDEYVELTTALIRDPRNPRVKHIFGDSCGALTIKLQPINYGQRGHRIYAWVFNMPWFDILGTRHGEPPKHRPADVHFAHFYRLSSYYEEANVPHALGRCHFRDEEHQGNPFCPPAQGAAHHDA